MADFTLSELQGAFEGALKTVFGGNSGPRPSAGGGTSSTSGQDGAIGVIGSIKKFASDVGTAGLPVVSAFLSIGSHGKEAATVFGNIASLGDKVAPGLGKTLGGFVQTLEQGRESIAQAGKQGVGGNNVLEFAAQTKAAGMTMEGNLKLLKDMGPSLTGIGLNAQDANQRFLKLSQDTIESKLGQSLAVAQGGVEGLNAAAAIMASNTKKNLREDAAGRAELAEASAKLAENIDTTSRVTGKSREVIEAELKERMKSPDAILAMNLMTDKQRMAFQQTQASLNGMGPSISNLAQNIASGARLTKENQNVLNALGPAAGDFQRAIKMQQSATTAAEKEAAARALEAAKAKINEWQSSQRYAQLALQGSGEIAETQKKLIAENKARAGAETTARETGQGFAQAQQTQAEIAKREREGKVGFGADAGKVDEGQTAMRLLNASQEEFRKNSVAASTELVKLNSEFGRSPQLIKGVATAVEALAGKFGETSAQKGERYVDARNKIKEVTGFNDLNNVGGPGASGPITPGTKLDVPAGQAPKREGGSKEATGNWFEDFGVGKIMELHKKEAVVPQDKLPEFMKDMMGKMQGSAQGIESAMSKKGNPLEQLTKQFENIKLPEIKMPKEAPDMFGQMEGQLKGLAGKLANIKQPEFPKLPILPKVPETSTTSQPSTAQQAQTKVEKAPETPAPIRRSETTSAEDVQTKILEALNQLNKTMGQMVAHTADISDASSKTARYAGKPGSRIAA